MSPQTLDSLIGADSLLEAEGQRQAAQFTLESKRNLRERNRLGQFPTPHGLALEMLHLAHEFWAGRGPVRLLDPAVGSGVFFSAALSVFGSEIGHAKGIDLDPAYADLAKRLWGPFGLDVVCDDFTRLMLPEASSLLPNLIVCNPPYVRHHHLQANTKHELRARVLAATGLKLGGLAGLYCYFLLLSHKWLANDGLGCWLIPTEFMDVNYGSAIRAYLSSQVTLLRLHRFDAADMQFEDALVTSAVAIFDKRPPTPQHRVEISTGGTLLRPASVSQIPIVDLALLSKWSHLTATTSLSASNHPASEAADLRLGDVFEIKRGIATGANAFFILPRQRATELGLPRRYLTPILPSPRLLRQQIIEADPDGFPQGTPHYVLVDCDLALEEIAQSYPALHAYLKTGQQAGLTSRYLMQQRHPWYRQEQRPPAPILCTYMGRAVDGRVPFRFFRNHSQATCPNVYLMLYPRPHMRQQFTPHLLDAIFEYLTTVGHAPLVDNGRVYGGGLHKIEPRELAQISIGELPAVRGLMLHCAVQPTLM